MPARPTRPRPVPTRPLALPLLMVLFGIATALPPGKSAAADAPAVPGSAATARPNILFCIADDWSWPHASAYGDKVVKTPTFDHVAAEGVLFTRSFCAAPSCTPSRAAVLTGQMPHRLAEGGNLHGFLPPRFPVYPDALEAAGYAVGHTGKAWGPGSLGERPRNPGGPRFKSFDAFLETVPGDKPFCFWFGSADPHRPYEKGTGAASGLKAEDVRVPAWLPDTPEVRNDILDYYFEVRRFDQSVGEVLERLKATGRADNTIVVITSDNGMPFPRCKTNLYDSGSHMPLAIRWPAKVKGGRTVDAFVSHTDLAPTFLEAAGLPPLPGTTGRSLVGLMKGEAPAPGGADPLNRRDRVFVERERHANVRKGDLSYPARALRNDRFLYVRNFEPDRWPGGDPEYYKAVGPFGDIDGGPSKTLLLDGRDDPKVAPFFALSCAKRPAEELYDLGKDPDQVRNVAASPEYAEPLATLRGEMDEWMTLTDDPRARNPRTDAFDRYPYFGGPGRDDAPRTQPARATRPARR